MEIKTDSRTCLSTVVSHPGYVPLCVNMGGKLRVGGLGVLHMRVRENKQQEN